MLLLHVLSIGLNMKMICLFLVILTSCATSSFEDSGELNQESYPSLDCEHPNTPYEAQIQAEYPDDEYLSVELVIEQRSEFWIGELKPPNSRNPMWHMTMQILDFDCRTPYIWNFFPKD